jgi:hypothetical protein
MFTAANVTTLADIAKIPVPVIWGAIEEKYNASTNPFRAAGVVKSDPLFQSRAAGEGSRTTVQSWNALPYATANISSDDPTEHSVPLKLTTRTWDAVRTHRNVSFSEMDLVVDLMGQDPLGNIAERVGAQFMPQDETARMFAILDGLVAADKADGSKITTTITDKVFDIQMLIAGLQKLGDAKASVKALGVSSATHALLAGQNVNGYVNPVAQTDIDFGTFAGKRLIVDDRFEDKVVGTKTLARIMVLVKTCSTSDAHPQRPLWKSSVTRRLVMAAVSPLSTSAGRTSSTQLATASRARLQSRAAHPRQSFALPTSGPASAKRRTSL